MKTIALIGQKGGTGKTTLAQLLLVSFEKANLTVAGIDLDPQTSLCSWGDLRQQDGPMIIPMAYSRLPQTLDAAQKDGVDICIIDTAGRAEQAALKAAQCADLVIVPMQPTSADLSTADATFSLLQMAKPANAFAVLVRVKYQGTRHNEATEYLTTIGYQVCEHTIGERVVYQDAAASGQTPEEYEPGGKAAHECERLQKFAKKLLNF